MAGNVVAMIPGVDMSSPLAAEIARIASVLQPNVGWEVLSGAQAGFTGQPSSAELTNLHGVGDEADTEAAWRAVAAAVLFADSRKQLDPVRVEVMSYKLQADQH
jgi:hypothetical protein